MGRDKVRSWKTWSDESLQWRREEPPGTESLRQFKSFPNGLDNGGWWIGREGPFLALTSFPHPHTGVAQPPRVHLKVCDCYHTHQTTHQIYCSPSQHPKRVLPVWYTVEILYLSYVKLIAFSSFYFRCSSLDQTRSLSCRFFTQQHVDVICSKFNCLHSQTNQI